MKQIRSQNGFSSYRTEPYSSTVSFLHLKTLNKKMEKQSKQALSALKELKKQKSMGKKNSKFVSDSLHKVETVGRVYASRLQEQHSKNQKLSQLVKYFENILSQNKKSQYEEEKNNMKKKKPFQFDHTNEDTSQVELKENREKQLADTNSHLKELEKKYEDIVLKSNSSSYQLSKKLDQVRMLRSERTVCSKMYDKFQKQIFDHQFLYKVPMRIMQQLVIERKVLDSIFNQKMSQFMKIEQETVRHCEKLLDKSKTDIMYGSKKNVTGSCITEGNLTNQQEFKKLQNFEDIRNLEVNEAETMRFMIQQKSQQKLKTQDNPSMFITKSKRSNTFSKMKNSLHFQQKQASSKQIKQMEFQKKVRQIFENLNVKNKDQFDEIDFETVQQQIENKYIECDKIFEEYYEKKQKLAAERDNVLWPHSQVEKWKKKIEQKRSIEAKYQEDYENLHSTEISIKEEIKQFEENELKKLKEVLNKNKEESIYIEEEEGDDKEEDLKIEITRVDHDLSHYLMEGFVSFEQYNKKDLDKDEDGPNSSRLEHILNMNKTTKNTANIYSEDELVAISRFNLHRDEYEEREGSSVPVHRNFSLHK